MNTNSLAAVALLLVAVAAGYGAFVSILVIRAPAYCERQKVAQILVAWLIPVIGAAMAHWLARHGVAARPAIERDPFRENELPE